MKYRVIYIIIANLLFLTSCKQESTLFTALSPQDTGVDFQNTITESDSLSILTFEYMNNGGGVALGDFNNDSLPDIYFTGNQVANKLYLNKGDLHFEDITDKAKVAGNGNWSSGVALVDINNDQKLDIYVCATAKKEVKQRTNLLYVNQGVDKDNIPIFKEMAEEYGIADTTHTTNAAFFDYDNDGDLDLYLVVNEMDDVRFPNKYHEKIVDGSSKRTDKLYRNEVKETGKIHFTDISKQAGILIEGYGLGVNITDINRDGWKDIYVTNDYLTNDLLYINQGGKGFNNQADAYFKHTSYSAMGNDVADINNDGLVDIVAVDMMPESNYRKKMMTPANNYVTYQNNDKYGYQYQYPRNTLQLNQGINPATGKPVFSEVGLLAGIAETDWSWTPMVTDFDNDGFRDIIITNGFPRDITDQDFIVYRAEMSNLVSKSMLLDSIPSVKIKNYAFRNKGNTSFGFENVTDEWGIEKPSFSNGAAYADLDNDGDLDYVVNNINETASIYKNNLTNVKPKESNFLRIKFKGNANNINGLGAWVEILYDNGQKQVYENTPYRGYLSTVETVAHFGLGKVQKVDEVKVLWQSGKSQVLKNVKANQVILVDEKDATTSPMIQSQLETTLFKDVTDYLNVTYKHEEPDMIDFNIQKLIPHKLSQFGPAIAVGDVNGDKLEDIFVGGASHHKGTFLLQNAEGKFYMKDLLQGADGDAKVSEDMGVLLFDAENDGDLDLYVVSGSYEFPKDSPALQDRFYENDGKGNFKLNEKALPSFLKSGSCVKATDFDRDGDLDLFVGGRVESGAYPKPVGSYILRNDSSKGVGIKFSDVTIQIAPQLQKVGMTCDALWTDFDNDGWQDLVLAGEWMPITFFKNNQGKLEFSSSNSGINDKVGWWNSLTAGDFDNDGDIDYIAGNVGENTLHRADDQHPVSIYAKDFNNDGNYDAIPTVYFKDLDGERKEFPYNTRDDLSKQFIQTRQRFYNYNLFAKATINEILKPEELKDALILRANWLKTSYIENKGNGKFEMKTLPIQTQYAPVFGTITEDFDQDGNLDVMLTGNDYATEVSAGRYDAFNGLVLKGKGDGSFVPLALQKSGYCISGDAKALVRLVNAQGKLLTITSQNRDKLKFFEATNPIKNYALQPTESAVMLKLKNGKTRKEEIGFGSSFLSQSSHTLTLNDNVQSAEAVNSKGNRRVLK